MKKSKWYIWKIILLSSLILLAGCKETILHNLSETDVNRLLTHLDGVKIEADKTKQPDGKWSIAVAGEDAIKAIKYLNDARLFRETANKITQQSSVISSREDQRFHFERALSAEIENTLSSVSGVLEARVHLNLPVLDPLFGEPVKGSRSSASVLLVTLGHSINSDEISALVSGASGVSKENISVLVTTTLPQPIASTAESSLTNFAKVESLKERSSPRTIFSRAALPAVAWSLVAGLASLLVIFRVRAYSQNCAQKYTLSK